MPEIIANKTGLVFTHHYYFERRRGKAMQFYVTLMFFLLTLSHCLASERGNGLATETTLYGTLSDGREVTMVRLLSPAIQVNVINYGGIITHIYVPDKNGVMKNVVLGYDELSDYEHRNRYFGAIIGRYANRIRQGALYIDNRRYQLAVNRPPHHLHGGDKGFDKQLWQAVPYQNDSSAGVKLTYFSPDGEQGYPGNLSVTVIYEIDNSGRLTVDYQAQSDMDTVFNPTQHTYFNLSGEADKNVLNHSLHLQAKHFLELGNNGLPTGKTHSVNNTPLDFTSAKLIGENIIEEHPQLTIGNGYDHYFIQRKQRGELTKFASLYHEKSGRTLDVWTTELGGQIYTGNYLSTTITGQNGRPMQQRQGICIETGQYPNAPAEPKFPLVIVAPDKPFHSTTQFRFSHSTSSNNGARFIP